MPRTLIPLRAILGVLQIGIKSQGYRELVMSDSEDSTVTYTAVSSPFEDGSDIGSPGVDGPPIMPKDPYAYIMAAYQPMYPEYMPQEDKILPAEEQPLPAAASPTADSPGYVPESDLKEEPKEDDEDPEEDPTDYPANRDNDDDEEEEEEHPASADSVPPVHRMTARISIRDEQSIALPPREEVERLLALTTPPPSLLAPLSSPLPQIPSPPLPASPPASVLPTSPPASPIRLLGYRAAMIRLRDKTPSTSHPLPLPTSSPPLQLLLSDRRTDRPEITLPPRKRLGVDLGPRAEEVGYGIRDVWVDLRETVEEVAPMTLEGVNTRVTELTAVQEQDTQDIYATARLLDQEALVSREAWGCSIEVSYMTRSKIMALRSVVMGQQAVISQL
ncbi:hypothetical protein Tco_1393706 [Tanacetum coccineum]